MPPKDNARLWFKMHSFLCSCKKKALICEIDKVSEFEYSKNHRKFDPDWDDKQMENMNSIIWRNVRVLQYKTMGDNNLFQNRKLF